MGTHNGYVDAEGSLVHKGEKTWDDLTPGNSFSWDEWTNWTVYSTTGNQSVSGAKGVPLIYQTSIIDLGASKSVYPDIQIGCRGSAKVVVEHSASSSDLSSSTTVLGSYTSTNATDGTGNYDETYYILDYADPGYEQPDKNTTKYVGFTARYIRITVFVERFASATERGVPILEFMNVDIQDKDYLQEFISVADTSTLSGSASARVIPLTRDIEPITQIFYSDTENTSGTNGKYVTKTVSKANKTFKTINLDLFEDTTGIDITNLDIHVIGIPPLTEEISGSIGRGS
jgi:hypothetical protein